MTPGGASGGAGEGGGGVGYRRGAADTRSVESKYIYSPGGLELRFHDRDTQRHLWGIKRHRD